MTWPDWLTYGTDGIVALQTSGSAALTSVMQALTFLGSEWFFLLLMPSVLWSLDAALGIRLGLALLVSGSLNAVMKLAAGLPRPFWVDPRVRALSFESSFGLPSGHAQNGVVLWGRLAAALRKPGVWAGALVLILAVSASRVYLGVHFPADVLAGWGAGLILLALLVWLEPAALRWFRSRRLTTRILFAGLGALAPLSLGGFAFGLAVVRRYPAAWAANYLAAGGAEGVFAPASPEGLIATTGALFGLAIGAVLLDHWGKFDGRRGGWQRPARFVVGILGVLALYLGLSAILPSGEVLRYLRYAVVGFWISYGAPRLFVALRIG